MDAFYDFLNRLPTLHKEKSPNWACIIGFLTGGLGLAIYFWSAIDAMITIVLFVVITTFFGAVTAGMGTLAGAIVAAIYGYFRALNSNERLSPETGVTETRVN